MRINAELLLEADGVRQGHARHSAAELARRGLTMRYHLILLGLGAKLRILVVVHSFQERQEVIRIISARKAVQRERDIYNQRWRS